MGRTAIVKSPVIVPLDFASTDEALAMARRLDPSLCRVKVGKELFTAAGPQVVDALMRMGYDVFLDLKYHDIPNTVAAACRVATRQGVWMVNMHAAGGRRMMEAAVEAIDTSATFGRSKPLVIAVTILTSLAADELPAIGLAPDVEAAVMRLATLARDCGLDGVVCAAAEVPKLKHALGPGFVAVTPGIRPAGDDRGDQTRVTTPAEATKMGSDYLVIGRPITHAPNPVAVLNGIVASIASQDAR